MKLYFKPGACSMASHIVLNELGLAYTLEQVDTARGVTQSGQRFRDINPGGYVPALALASGEVITENAAILEFLADLPAALGKTAPIQLAPPVASLERTRLREWLGFLSSELHKAFSPFFSGVELSPAARKEAEAKLRKRLSLFEKKLSRSGDYLLGDRLSVADIYAFVILNWCQFIGVSLADWPAAFALWQKIGARPNAILAMQQEGLLPEKQTEAAAANSASQNQPQNHEEPA